MATQGRERLAAGRNSAGRSGRRQERQDDGQIADTTRSIRSRHRRPMLLVPRAAGLGPGSRLQGRFNAEPIQLPGEVAVDPLAFGTREKLPRFARQNWAVRINCASRVPLSGFRLFRFVKWFVVWRMRSSEHLPLAPP